MLTPELLNYILAFVTLGSIAFAIWNRIHNPIIDLDKRQALSDEEADNKALRLAEQFKSERETSREKFVDITKRLDDAFLLAQNHTKTVDTKVDKLVEGVNSMNVNFTREIGVLSTIINERIPKR